jgi:hypothetical protein
MFLNQNYVMNAWMCWVLTGFYILKSVKVVMIALAFSIVGDAQIVLGVLDYSRRIIIFLMKYG